MMTRLLCLAASVYLLIFVVTGCDSERDSLTSALDGENVDTSDDATAAAYKFFTGRDSFGIALKIRLAGDAVVTAEGPCPDETVILSGSGNATHLGQINGSLSHCIEDGDHSSVFDGQFTFTGSTGGIITGQYEPLPVITGLSKHENDAGVVIETKADITGGEVSAVMHDDVEGRGDLRILLMTDGSLTQTFDGWLLHHLADG